MKLCSHKIGQVVWAYPLSISQPLIVEYMKKRNSRIELELGYMDSTVG